MISCETGRIRSDSVTFPGTRRREPLHALTSLRFVAAFIVITTHFGPSRLAANTYVASLLSAGYEAVAFFFMLSGFILVYVYASEKPGKLISSNVAFWIARMARIAPAYYLGLALSMTHFLYAGLASKMIAPSAFYEALVLAPLLMQAWCPPAALAWNVPAWSLSVEALFYAAFPAMWRAVGQAPRTQLLLVTIASIGLCDLRLISLPFQQYGSTAYNFIAFFPIFHLPLFLAGTVLGRLFLTRHIPIRKSHTIPALVALLVLLTCKPSGYAVPGILLVPIFALLILSAAQLKGGDERGLTSKRAVWLGELSYAMYIIHVPVIWLWSVLTRAARIELPAYAEFAVDVTSIVIISSLVLIYIERPLRPFLHGRLLTWCSIR